ncbi:glycoside hydrolase family 140 protein [Porphyromonadaceae bacterium]
MKNQIGILVLIVISILSSNYAYGEEKNKLESSPQGELQVSKTKRYLQYADGNPFFYLGDTAWELFHRLTREEADHYLTVRAAQGFTVIQAVALAEFDGLKTPNAYGHLPFVAFDPAKPDIKPGDANDYWDHVDYIVDLCNQKGLFVGFLPTWGRYWNDGEQPLFNPDNAYQYGRFVGERYRTKKLIWILGGDRPADTPKKLEIIRAMAKGIRDAGARQLMTFHPNGGAGSSQWLHNEAWLDFNMRQNGHSVNYTNRYSKTNDDYRLSPTKPIIDAEPIYEDHPIDFNPDNLGHSTAADVRRTFYWDLFEGSFGYTYGNHSVWQMYDPASDRESVNRPILSWQEAIHQPGATQMIHGKRLIESRPFDTRVPSPELIVSDRYPSIVPGAGRYRFVATSNIGKTYAMIYVPIGRKFKVNTQWIQTDTLRLSWFDPRTGESRSIGEVSNREEPMEFISPTPGENLDWVLVIN